MSTPKPAPKGKRGTSARPKCKTALKAVYDPRNSRYLTVRHACNRYGVGTTTMRNLIRDGSIVAVKLRKSTLVDCDSADLYFAALPRFTPGRRVGTKEEAA